MRGASTIASVIVIEIRDRLQFGLVSALLPTVQIVECLPVAALAANRIQINSPRRAPIQRAVRRRFWREAAQRGGGAAMLTGVRRLRVTLSIKSSHHCAGGAVRVRLE